ncbi:stage III sporulation protein AC [Dethiothermospora halolimnae]|uniref:stage III sporulation protein AC n=1 Tax=Dethiothermospora halolimnae TaxID=3114390 RepID=UPI003CCBCC5C
MNISLILKISGIGILLGILHTILSKQGKEEYAHIATIAGVIIAFTMIMGIIGDLFDSVKTIFKLY